MRSFHKEAIRVEPVDSTHKPEEALAQLDSASRNAPDADSKVSGKRKVDSIRELMQNSARATKGKKKKRKKSVS